jgi:large subunit ribosomal protein L15
MPHKLRKIRKTRGSRTQGYGRIGQHRDAGSRGNRKVGRHKHLWSKVTNQTENYFGKSGFTSPKALHTKVHTINLKQLAEFAQNQLAVNLTEMGFTKLLGAGKVTKPINVIVPACSAAAEEKIKAAGGKITTETLEQTVEAGQ